MDKATLSIADFFFLSTATSLYRPIPSPQESSRHILYSPDLFEQLVTGNILPSSPQPTNHPFSWHTRHSHPPCSFGRGKFPFPVPPMCPSLLASSFPLIVIHVSNVIRCKPPPP